MKSVGDDFHCVGRQLPQSLSTGLGAPSEKPGAQATTRLQRRHGGQRPTGGRQGEPASGGSALTPRTRVDLGPHSRHRSRQESLGGGLEPPRRVVLSVDVIGQSDQVGA